MIAKPIWAGLLAAVVVLVTMVTSPTSAHADESAPGQHPVVLVTDFSGSMNTADADASGMTRIDAAKQAVGQLLATTPEDARLGLVVFGTESDACTDIRTLHPVAAFDADALTAEVNALRATGNTPIGPALLHAADELANIEGPRSIILISDGEPNCEPPPACDVAQELADRGIDLTVHTIGFRISQNQKAQEVLKCIAATTGGEYMDADDAEQLNDVLAVQAERALSPYETEGEEIVGGLSYEEAVEILPGQYVTRLFAGDRFDIQQTAERQMAGYFTAKYHEGWTLVVSATLAEPVNVGANVGNLHGISVGLVGEQSYCYPSDYENNSGQASRGTGAVTATVVMRDLHGGQDSNCLTDGGEVGIRVLRYGESWADQMVDVEFQVSYIRNQPLAGEVFDPTTDAIPAPTSVDPVPLAGGSSYNAPAELSSGVTISDSIVPGERRYFVVPATNGESISMRLDFTQDDTGVTTVGAFVANPLRERMRFFHGPNMGGLREHLHTVRPSAGDSIAGYLAAGIAPSNRGTTFEQAHSIPGLQHIVVYRRWDSDSANQELPFNLTVDVFGDPVEGGYQAIQTAEAYLAEFGEPEAEPTQEPTPEVTPSPSETPEETPEPEPSVEASEEPVVEAEVDDATSPWVLILGGAGIGLVLVGIGWLVLRRR